MYPYSVFGGNPIIYNDVNGDTLVRRIVIFNEVGDVIDAFEIYRNNDKVIEDYVFGKRYICTKPERHNETYFCSYNLEEDAHYTETLLFVKMNDGSVEQVGYIEEYKPVEDVAKYGIVITSKLNSNPGGKVEENVIARVSLEEVLNILKNINPKAPKKVTNTKWNKDQRKKTTEENIDNKVKEGVSSKYDLKDAEFIRLDTHWNANSSVPYRVFKKEYIIQMEALDFQWKLMFLKGNLKNNYEENYTINLISCSLFRG